MGVIYMAIIFTLVKPESNASQVIVDVSNALSNLVYAAIKGEAK